MSGDRSTAEERRRPSRRTFLRMLAVGGAAAVVAGVAERQADLVTRARHKVFGAPPSRSDAGGIEELYRVGERFLSAYPDEGSRDRLRADLGAPRKNEMAWFAALRDRIRDDFAADRTVKVDGWHLARTEARAAALLHLER